jgi:hypothetical protein
MVSRTRLDVTLYGHCLLSYVFQTCLHVWNMSINKIFVCFPRHQLQDLYLAHSLHSTATRHVVILFPLRMHTGRVHNRIVTNCATVTDTPDPTSTILHFDHTAYLFFSYKCLSFFLIINPLNSLADFYIVFETASL